MLGEIVLVVECFVAHTTFVLLFLSVNVHVSLKTTVQIKCFVTHITAVTSCDVMNFDMPIEITLGGEQHVTLITPMLVRSWVNVQQVPGKVSPLGECFATFIALVFL